MDECGNECGDEMGRSVAKVSAASSLTCWACPGDQADASLSLGPLCFELSSPEEFLQKSTGLLRKDFQSQSFCALNRSKC